MTKKELFQTNGKSYDGFIPLYRRLMGILWTLTVASAIASHNQYHRIYESFDSENPIILEAGWGLVKIRFQGQITYKNQEKGKRADTVFTPEGHFAWNWRAKEFCIRHHPGYHKRSVQHLISLYPEATHIILTLGYQNVLCVDHYRHRSGPVPEEEIEKVRGFIHEVYPDHKAEILIGDTSSAILWYNKLLQNKDNKVLMLAHFTC